MKKLRTDVRREVLRCARSLSRVVTMVTNGEDGSKSDYSVEATIDVSTSFANNCLRCDVSNYFSYGLFPTGFTTSD